MQQTDILIIGGGIAGASTAYFLSQHGHSVTLLERGDIAGEASGLNAGTFWATGWGTTPDLASTLSMGSLDSYRTLQDELGQDIEFQQNGSLKVIQTEAEWLFAQEEARELTAKGHQVQLLDKKDTLSIEPELSPAIYGSLYYPHGGNADPVKATRTLASLAEQQGAIVLTNHEVIGIDYLDNGTYRIVTSAETFAANTLILAAGPWFHQLEAMLGLRIPVYAVRGQMWATAPVPTKIAHSISAMESTLFWHTHPYSDDHTPLELTHHGGTRLTRHLYGRQRRDGAIIFGGDRQVDAPKIPDPAGIEANHAHVLELFPFLRALPITRTWAGWMPFTRDLQPLIGKIPHFDNLYIVTGLSSSGFEQGPMTGKMVAEYVHGQSVPAILEKAERQIGTAISSE